MDSRSVTAMLDPFVACHVTAAEAALVVMRPW
jgi:hypothetical protein